MIAMQYGFVLPADYDMSIIDRRIADKGGFTDGLPDLVFKAYLSSCRNPDHEPAGENRYAPFYLWSSNAGMNDFLAGPGFVALSRSFGWPSVQTWSVWHAQVGEHIERTCFATRELVPIRPYSRLDELRASEAEHAGRQRALAAVSGFDPTTWTLVRLQLWESLPPDLPLDRLDVYSVGHVSRAAV